MKKNIDYIFSSDIGTQNTVSYSEGLVVAFLILLVLIGTILAFHIAHN
jgi:hypothetical protein